MSSLFESFLSTPEVTEALSDRAVIEAMLRFEGALARAQANAGLIPQTAAQSIIGTCKVELFDVPKLVRESARCRSLATPLVTSLRETVALFNPDAASLVHVGCTDQELVDTALALVTRDILTLIEGDLAQTVQVLLRLAAQHTNDAMLARDAQQAAAVTTFGLTCSQWVAPLARSQQRLRSAADCALSLRLGSEIVTRAALQGKDTQVMTQMATDLQLNTPSFAGNSSHDDAVVLACELGLLVGNLGKIAGDIAHLAQFEIGELAPTVAPTAAVPGAKSVPPVPMDILCMAALAAAQRVPQQVATLLATLSLTNDTSPGNWQTQLAQWPALLTASQTITQAVAHMVGSLHADTPRMRSNLDAVRARLPAKEVKTRLSAELAQQAAALTHVQIAALLALRPCAPQPSTADWARPDIDTRQSPPPPRA